MKLTLFVVVAAAAAVTPAWCARSFPSGEFVWANSSNTSVLPYGMQLSELNLTSNATSLTVSKLWTFGSDVLLERQMLLLDGSETQNPVASRIFYTNVFLGIEYNTSAFSVMQLTKATELTSQQNRIEMSVRKPLLTSQGHAESHEIHSIALTDAGCAVYHLDSVVPVQKLSFWLRPRSATSLSICAGAIDDSKSKKSSSSYAVATTEGSDSQESYPYLARQHGTVPKHREDPAANEVAFFYNVTDSWFQSDLDFQVNAMMIGLQGLVNGRSSKPMMYLTYPAGWAYSYTASVFDYVLDKYNLRASKLAGINATGPMNEFVAALSPLREGHPIREAANLTGVVLWDTTIRSSLMVSMTVAGLRNALVVSPELYAKFPSDLADSLPVVANFSTMFRGKAEADVYGWAYDHYFDECTHSYLMWMGGECNAGEVRPAVADFGTSQGAFFVDLNTTPNNTDPEFVLANKIVGATANASGGDFLLQGWHSYCKDQEHTFTTLASRHGGRVHGLNTNPNLSFMHNLQLPSNFSFRNNHAPPATLDANQVYVTFVQTDGIGLGAWTLPGRGSLPYAWEVTLPDLWIQPALLRMFYDQATPNDTFIGALSGPGYMYPKAIPKPQLGTLLSKTQGYLHELDLHHMVVFDASATSGEHTATGDCNLPQDVVNAYFEHMSSTVGFLNGYAPAFTGAYSNTSVSMQVLVCFEATFISGTWTSR